jgi:hypothetical protein
VIDTAQKARQLLDEISSPYLEGILDAADEESVMLERAFEIRLRLAEGVALPEEPLELQATLTRLVPSGERAARSQFQLLRRGEPAGVWNPGPADGIGSFDRTRETHLFAQDLGVLAVQFHLIRRGASGDVESIEVAAAQASGVLTVGAGDADKVFIVAPDADDLAAAVEELR